MSGHKRKYGPAVGSRETSFHTANIFLLDTAALETKVMVTFKIMGRHECALNASLVENDMFKSCCKGLI